MSEFFSKVSFKAIILGLLIALVFETIIQVGVSFYLGFDLMQSNPDTPMEDLALLVNQSLFQQPYVSVLMINGIIGSIIAGFMTIFFAKKEFLNNIIALIIFALIVNFTFLPAMKDFPMWALAFSFISVPPFMYLGGVLARRKYIS